MKVLVTTPENIEIFEYDQVYYVIDHDKKPEWLRVYAGGDSSLVGLFKEWTNVRIVEDE